MPDISMCADDKCPSRESCYRFKATPSKFLQSWGQFGRPDGDDKCSYYWPVESKSQLKRLDILNDI